MTKIRCWRQFRVGFFFFCVLRIEFEKYIWSKYNTYTWRFDSVWLSLWLYSNFTSTANKKKNIDCIVLSTLYFICVFRKPCVRIYTYTCLLKFTDAHWFLIVTCCFVLFSLYVCLSICIESFVTQDFLFLFGFASHKIWFHCYRELLIHLYDKILWVQQQLS